MRLADRSTVRIARDMRSRISPSRLKDLTIRAPSTVSPIVCTICVEPSNERLANTRTFFRMPPTNTATTGSVTSAPSAIRGIAGDHYRDEADHGKEVARKTLDDELQRVADAVGGKSQPRDELAGMPILEIGDVLVKQALEDAPLRRGDDAVADPRKHDQRAEGRRAAHHEEAQRLPGEKPHLAKFFGGHHAVQHRPQQPGDRDVGERDEGEEYRGEEIAEHMLAPELAKEPDRRFPFRDFVGSARRSSMGLC